MLRLIGCTLTYNLANNSLVDTALNTQSLADTVANSGSSWAIGMISTSIVYLAYDYYDGFRWDAAHAHTNLSLRLHPSPNQLPCSFSVPVYSVWQDSGGGLGSNKQKHSFLIKAGRIPLLFLIVTYMLCRTFSSRNELL